MERHFDNTEVEALYFNFYHFYGIPNQVGIAGYRQAPRIIRNSLRTIAPDGLFWVVLDNNKRGRYPNAMYAGGNIYHYGHCRSTLKMAEKLKQIGKYWNSDHQPFEGYGNIDLAELRPFRGTHPAVMKQWLESEAESTFSQSPHFKPTLRDLRNRARFTIEKMFILEVSKKHFKALD